jgi:hypothetical protein
MMAVRDVTEENQKMRDELQQFRAERDMVNHPPHYNNSAATCDKCGDCIECIEVTRHMPFSLGNAVKYLWRWQDKGGLEDLKKARWYLEDAIKDLERRQTKSE